MNGNHPILTAAVANEHPTAWSSKPAIHSNRRCVMQFIRRTVLVLTATLFAVVAGTGTALAGPKPLPPSSPDFAPSTSGGASSSGGFLDSWPQVTLAILVVAAVLAIAVVGVSRLRHHSPSTA